MGQVGGPGGPPSPPPLVAGQAGLNQADAALNLQVWPASRSVFLAVSSWSFGEQFFTVLGLGLPRASISVLSGLKTR